MAVGIVFSLVGIGGQVPFAMEVSVAAEGCLRSSGRPTCYDASIFLGHCVVAVCVISDLSYVVYYVDIVVDCLAILW